MAKSNGQAAPRTADDVLGAIHLAQDEVRLCLDGRLNLEQSRLLSSLDAAQAYDRLHNEPDTAPAVARELGELQDRIHAAEQTFVLQALPGPDWRDLEAAHPPTEDQAKVRMPHNPETFWPAVIAASIVDPAGWTPAKVESLAGLLNGGQWQRLTEAAWALNKGAGTSPLSQAALKLLQGFDVSLAT